MMVGDEVECTKSCDNLYTVGNIYLIEGLDLYGHPLLRDDFGHLSDNVGQPLNGKLWSFEVVK